LRRFATSSSSSPKSARLRPTSPWLSRDRALRRWKLPETCS
jgi:hypothetical protein